MNIDSSTFFGLIIGLIVWCIILREIIYSGTQASKRKNDDEIKIQLLSKIANKLGVPDDEIHSIIHVEANKLKK